MYVDVAQKSFIEYRVTGYYDDSLNAFAFNLNLQSINSTIQFDRTFSTPFDLQMHNSINLQMLLWQDSTGEINHDVKYYNVYWKRNSEAYFQFLDHVINKTYYQTNHT